MCVEMNGKQRRQAEMSVGMTFNGLGLVPDCYQLVPSCTFKTRVKPLTHEAAEDIMGHSEVCPFQGTGARGRSPIV